MLAVGIAVMVEPLSVFPVPVKLCDPVLAVNVVALLAKLPAIAIVAAFVSFHTAPEFKVTFPVKVLVPVFAKVRVPVTEVVPVTPKVHELVAPVVKVVPVPTVKFPAIVVAATVVAVAVPLKVKLPPIAAEAVCSVLAPLPESERL